MEHLELMCFDIAALNADHLEWARQRQSQLTKPMGSLGLLENLAVQLSGIQGTQTPAVGSAKCLIFAADHPVVSRALRFISENAHKPIKVNDVANKTGINRRSLERQFHQSLNKSVAGEITRLRIARVKRHLIESTSPLKTVARECGFRNADHLYKVFTRIEKITPSQYRNQLSNQGIA